MKHVNIDDVGSCDITCPQVQAMLDPKDAPTSEGDFYLCENHEQYWRGVLSPDPDPETGEQELTLVMVPTVPRAAIAKIG